MMRATRMESGGYLDDDVSRDIADRARRQERQAWARRVGMLVAGVLVVTNPHIFTGASWLVRTVVDNFAKILSPASPGARFRLQQPPLREGRSFAESTPPPPSSAGGLGTRAAQLLPKRRIPPQGGGTFLQDMQRALGDAPCVSSAQVPQNDTVSPCVLLSDGTLLIEPAIVGEAGKTLKLNEESEVCRRTAAKRRERVQVAHGAAHGAPAGGGSTIAQHPGASRQLIWLAADYSLCLQHALDALAGRCDQGTRPALASPSTRHRLPTPTLTPPPPNEDLPPPPLLAPHPAQRAGHYPSAPRPEL